MAEKWVPIPNWCDTHQISDYGNIRGVAGRIRGINEHMLNESTITKYAHSSSGVLMARIHYKKRSLRFHVARMMLLVFHGYKSCPNKEKIIYRDNNKNNCHIDNITSIPTWMLSRFTMELHNLFDAHRLPFEPIYVEGIESVEDGKRTITIK